MVEDDHNLKLHLELHFRQQALLVVGLFICLFERQLIFKYFQLTTYIIKCLLLKLCV